jgi:hypothetical protein
MGMIKKGEVFYQIIHQQKPATGLEKSQ